MTLALPRTTEERKSSRWDRVRLNLVVPIGVVVAVAIVCVIFAVLSSAQRADEVSQRLAVEREQERAASARALEKQRSQEQQLRVSEHQKAKQRALNRDRDSGLEL